MSYIATLKFKLCLIYLESHLLCSLVLDNQTDILRCIIQLHGDMLCCLDNIHKCFHTLPHNILLYILNERNLSLLPLNLCFFGLLLWTKCKNTIFEYYCVFHSLQDIHIKIRCRSQNKTLQNTLVKYLKNNIRYITVIFVNISKIQIFRTNIVKCADML